MGFANQNQGRALQESLVAQNLTMGEQVRMLAGRIFLFQALQPILFIAYREHYTSREHLFLPVLPDITALGREGALT